MASNRKAQRKMRTNSDPVTGERLVPGTLRIVVRDYDPSRSDRACIPMRLHSSVDEGVGKQYSPAFARYLRNVQPTERVQWRKWWTVPYVVQRLYAHFSPDVVDIVVTCLAGDDPDEVVALHRQHTTFWIEKQRRAMHRFVRAHLLPYDSQRPATIAS